MIRGVTAKLVLLLALFSLPLQGMVSAGMLGCQMKSGTDSMGMVSATMSGNGMGMGERCKTSLLGVHGAGGCKVCPSCTLCPAAACTRETLSQFRKTGQNQTHWRRYRPYLNRTLTWSPRRSRIWRQLFRSPIACLGGRIYGRKTRLRCDVLIASGMGL
jgi:hypothetical protein